MSGSQYFVVALYILIKIYFVGDKMCTALNCKTKDHYFGRNLDLDHSYGEEVCVVPRNFSLKFRKINEINNHYAIIGMATVVADIPLFYDATNEHGLSMAGLNFPSNAHYTACIEGKDNICQFELIPYILGTCQNLDEALILLEKINIVNIPFSDNLPVSPLHWAIAYKDSSIVVESMSDGLHIYHNPTGVMTNNPPFEYHLFNLNNYRNLNIINGNNTFSNELKLDEYCQGLGALGLPGDVSSMSRFIRATFNKEHSVCSTDEKSSVSQFFHLLTSVEMCRGSCLVPSGHYDITIYSSCINTDKGLYYYTTYDNRQINCIDMYKTDLDSDKVSRYRLKITENINYQN